MEENRDTCKWCGMEVVSFVGPPLMVTVTVEAPAIDFTYVSRICAFCHAELLKLIAARHDGGPAEHSGTGTTGAC